MDKPWAFDQPPDCAVITVSGILERGEPVLRVTHDREDHGWQFLLLESPDMADARVVALEEMLQLDPTLAQLADLPVGWRAWRRSAADDWIREANPNDRG